jgi:hypothetical protein
LVRGVTGSLDGMDEESTRGDRQPDEGLPGSVSDQNSEEQQPEHEDRSERRGSSSGKGSPSGGESKEGSQSTGNPGAAG